MRSSPSAVRTMTGNARVAVAARSSRRRSRPEPSGKWRSRSMASRGWAPLASGAQPLDAMLLDLHLPDGSGLDLLRELRAATATRAFPVIVLTAEGEDRILREAESLRAGLLTKPFSPSKLTARIAAILGDGPPPSVPPVPQDPR